MTARTRYAAHENRRIHLEDVVSEDPDNHRWYRAGDKADDEDLERQNAGQLRQQRIASVNADDGDKHDKAEILEHIAGCRGRIAKEAQP